ncbi:hypothetical protein FB451DRAFT_1412160 [Mycena latifolia]|nr:hypothetical protein FB451DRAFT_1412160 [Mycena latifolia]
MASGTLLFPSTRLQILSSLIHFIGLTVLTHLLSRRLAAEDLSSKKALARLTWPRLCTLLVFLDSWLFLFTSGVLIFGVGLETHEAGCLAGIYLCIVFYASSKLLIYAFLIEKVYVVWAVGPGGKRSQSPVYIASAVTVGLYGGIVALLFFGRISQFRDGDKACVIGLKPTASIAMLSYDLYINVFLTALFLWPLLRSSFSTPQLKRVAIRTLLSSAAALTTSTINMVVLTVLKGHELGWVCLASCGTDVVLNAIALFWVTGASRQGTTLTNSCVECERRIETTSDGLILNISPKNGKRDSIRHNHDLDLGGRRHSMLKSMNIFRMGSVPREAQEFKIHVTTEFDSSTSPSATDSSHAEKPEPEVAPKCTVDTA